MGRLDPRALALLVLGAVAIAVSLVLTPTPDVIVPAHGGAIRSGGGMQGVDWAIILLRVVGIPALLAGTYLAYRSFHADAMVAGEDLPGRPHGSNENLPIQGGDPARRGIKDTFGGSF
jgi:hypothetical protein